MSHPPAADLSMVQDMVTPPGGDSDMRPGDRDMVTPGNQDMTTGSVDMTPPSECPYPMGPYSSKKGGVLDPTISFLCLKPGETSGPGTMMTVQDFFDCHGTKKMNALLFDVSALWCGPCNDEADQLEGKWSSKWMASGVVPITLLLDGATNGKAATIQDAASWVKNHKLKNVYVCAAPKTKVYTGMYIPFNAAVDPRTMKVEDAGSDNWESSLDTIAQRNK